jgi:hypothetical protein
MWGCVWRRRLPKFKGTEERVDEVKFLLKVECEQFVIFSKLFFCFTPRTPQELSRDMGSPLTHQITTQTALTYARGPTKELVNCPEASSYHQQAES